MGHGHKIEIKQENFTVPGKAKQFAMIFMILGLILTGIGIFTLDGNESNHAEVNNTHATVTLKVPVVEVVNHEDGHEASAEGHEHSEVSEGKNGHSHDMDNDHGEHAAAVSHGEHHNVETEQFGPRMEYHAQDKPASTKIWANLLTAGYYFFMVSLCALFWYAIQYAANAGWSVSIKRVPEAIYTFFPIAFVVLIIAAFLGKDDIYHWAHYEHLGLKPGDTGYDKVLDGKSGFLNTGMLFILPTILVAIWYFLGNKMRKLSLAEDTANAGDVTFFRKTTRLSAGFLVLFGFTISIVAWLFIMSVDAHWYSTIFGVYNFATSWVSSISVILIFVLYLKSQGHLNLVNKEHQHDLGKFMFAFTVFWAYIWLFQYLLIWYAHIPEEMMYYQLRFEQYKTYFLANFVINFVLPFAFLLMRTAKRTNAVIISIGALLFVGHYFDVWFMVMPGVFGPGMHIGLLDIGIFVFFTGLFVYWVLNQLTKRGLVAVNHPYLEESVYHDTGV